MAFEALDFSGEIAVGELGLSPGNEIAVSPGPGNENPPRVRIFDSAGMLLNEFEVPSLDWGYGLWISIGCGKLYLTPGPAPDAPAVARAHTWLVLKGWRRHGLIGLDEIPARA